MVDETLEITTGIVLIDVVRYSLMNNEEQLRAVEVIHSDLTKEINFIAELTNLRNNEVVLDCVPTGDGLYVLVDPQVCGYGIPLGISIRNYLLWFASHQTDRLYHGIRVAVHSLKDNVHLAQVDETRARVLLAQGRTVEAEKTSRSAVHRLEKGDELSLLAEALVTHGIALAGLDHTEQARAALKRAAKVAEQAGDFESAGLAALTLVEQLGANLSDEEIGTAIDRAGVLLDDTRDMGTLRRLINVFRVTFAVPAPIDWTDFSYKTSVCRYEAHLIRLALNETNGLVTRAARALGFKHHQSLVSLIDTRSLSGKCEIVKKGNQKPLDTI